MILNEIGNKVVLTNGGDSTLKLLTFSYSTYNQVTQKKNVVLSDTTYIGNVSYGSLFDYSSSSVTTISSSSTWYILNCSTTSSFTNGFTHSNGRLTCSKSYSKPFKLEGNISLSSGNNNEISVAFYKNGVLIPCSESHLITTSSGKAQSCNIQCITDLNVGDYIEVYIMNDTSATNVTLRHLNVIITELR